MDDEEKDIYDTSIYIDYADLPKERQKALYAEFAASDPNEKKLSRLLTAVPLVFCIAVAALMLAAVVVAFVSGARRVHHRQGAAGQSEIRARIAVRRLAENGKARHRGTEREKIKTYEQRSGIIRSFCNTFLLSPPLTRFYAV